jgi:hypothetical protein
MSDNTEQAEIKVEEKVEIKPENENSEDKIEKEEVEKKESLIKVNELNAVEVKENKESATEKKESSASIKVKVEENVEDDNKKETTIKEHEEEERKDDNNEINDNKEFGNIEKEQTDGGRIENEEIRENQALNYNEEKNAIINENKQEEIEIIPEDNNSLDKNEKKSNDNAPLFQMKNINEVDLEEKEGEENVENVENAENMENMEDVENENNQEDENIDNVNNGENTSNNNINNFSNQNLILPCNTFKSHYLDEEFEEKLNRKKDLLENVNKYKNNNLVSKPFLINKNTLLNTSNAAGNNNSSINNLRTINQSSIQEEEKNLICPVNSKNRKSPSPDKRNGNSPFKNKVEEIIHQQNINNYTISQPKNDIKSSFQNNNMDTRMINKIKNFYPNFSSNSSNLQKPNMNNMNNMNNRKENTQIKTVQNIQNPNFISPITKYDYQDNDYFFQLYKDVLGRSKNSKIRNLNDKICRVSKKSPAEASNYSPNKDFDLYNDLRFDSSSASNFNSKARSPIISNLSSPFQQRDFYQSNQFQFNININQHQQQQQSTSDKIKAANEELQKIIYQIENTKNVNPELKYKKNDQPIKDKKDRENFLNGIKLNLQDFTLKKSESKKNRGDFYAGFESQFEHLLKKKGNEILPTEEEHAGAIEDNGNNLMRNNQERELEEEESILYLFKIIR